MPITRRNRSRRTFQYTVAFPPMIIYSFRDRGVKLISNNTYRRRRLRRRASRQFLLVSALSTGALISVAAYGRSRTSAQEVTASDDSELKEVVVTAQKRSERLVDVPISISVVTPDLLASTDSKNLNELSGAVPGIQFMEMAASGAFSVRSLFVCRLTHFHPPRRHGRHNQV